MSQPQILINQMGYNLSSGDPLFTKLTMAFACQKTGLVGRNGIGKSTLLKLIIGELSVNTGSIYIDGTAAYVPQHFTAAPESTMADLLGFRDKLEALDRISAGSIDERDYAILNDEWDIEDRIQKQLAIFDLQHLPHTRLLNTLSGGEITRLLLVKAFLTNADFILLDEPTNHLDATARQQLYAAIQAWKGGLIVVSHDRALLNNMECMIELTTLGANAFGGNYDNYREQKDLDTAAKESNLADAKKTVLKNKAVLQATKEKLEKRQANGRKAKLDGSIDKVGGDARKDRGGRSLNTMSVTEERMTASAEENLLFAKEQLEIREEIHIDLPDTYVPTRKMIVEIENLSFGFPNTSPMIENFNLLIQGPERIALRGDNGSGKTTLVKLILGELTPNTGTINVGTTRVNYLDQNASFLRPDLSILDNFLLLNTEAKQNDAYRCLAQFLFRNIATHQLVRELSGGEKLRALLACVLMSKQPPQLLILDEPTNHLDLTSIDSIESALSHYQGAMIVISHDQHFLSNIGVTKVITSPFKQ